LKNFLLALITMPLWAADLNPKVLNLISANTQLVGGANMERHRNSALGAVFPVNYAAKQSVFIETLDGNESRTLLLSIGGEPATDVDSRSLDSYTVVSGDPSAIEEATQLWAREDIQPSPMAFRARQLAGIYDHWFLMSKPLDFLIRPHTTLWPLKYRDEMVNTIEELSGGIRFGTSIEFKAEAVMRTNEDAKALAALGRWLPGLLQLMPSPGFIGPLVDIAEKISATADGRIVTLTCSLSDDKVKEVAARWQALQMEAQR
jgi:hypothetical protein